MKFKFKPPLWSGLAGILFAVGWWLLVDGVATRNAGYVPPTSSGSGSDSTSSSTTSGDGSLPVLAPKFAYYLPAIGSTLALIMINLANLNDLRSDGGGLMGENPVAKRVKVWLFVSFTLMFACVAGGIIIFATKYADTSVYMGITFLAQPLFVLTSALILLFARKKSGDDDDDFPRF